LKKMGVYQYLLFQGLDHYADVSPEQEAVRFMGNYLTYHQLSTQSNQLAHALLDAGIRRGDRVGIYMNKCLESIVSLYGIMKAGAAYVPLDAFAPVERLRFVINDCGIRVLLSNDGMLESIQEVLEGLENITQVIGPEWDGKADVLFVPWIDVNTLATEDLPAIQLTEQDLAYILYTSGSTGVPKGIMHTHRSGLSFAEWASSTYGLHQSDRVSNHAPLHFDLSTFDIFAVHASGATTVVIPEGMAKFPTSVANFIEQEKISVWYSVPFALIQMLQHGNLANRNVVELRWILFAGEPFPPKHLRKLMSAIPHARYSNLYGPTETNVCTFYHVPAIPGESDESIPIGRSCENIETLVIDDDDKTATPGEVGELLIRGGVVMRGYWGQAEKTEKSFHRRDLILDSPDIFYRTGDLVRLNKDGDFEFLGRKDRQIKTRGFRVELDEIEVVLLADLRVQEAAVFAVPDGDGSNIIEGVVVLTEGEQANPDDLIEFLSKHLPPYSIPNQLWICESFPRTSTGKIDRRALQSRVKDATHLSTR